MNIALLTAADYDQFYTLRLTALETSPGAYATDAQAWRDAPRETIERLLSRSETEDGVLLLGAWADDQLVGMLGMNCDLRPTVAHKGTLWGFYMLADYRRRGIGRALVEEMIIRAAKIGGMRQLRAVVNVGLSQEALILFEAAGFEPYGREVEAKKVGEQFYDQIFVWCRL